MKENKSLSVPFNDLARGWIANSEEIKDILARVARSGSYIQSLEHEQFEEDLANFLGAKFAMGVANGTDALHIALLSLGCSKGSKVVTVANAGGYTSIAAAKIGCQLIYCDVDPDRLQMSVPALKALLNEDVKAVVVTHLFGNVAPVDVIKALCDDYGIPVIEDCAQAFGGFLGTKRVGTIGSISTFSFYPTKNLGGIGDGGAIVTSDAELAIKIRSLRQYGWKKKYEIDIPGGVNSRLDEIQAAILRVGLQKIDELNSRRLKVLSQYHEAFMDLPAKLVSDHSTNSTSHLAVLRVPSEFSRDELIDTLSKSNIQSAIHYPTLDCDQKGFEELSFSQPLIPESKRAVLEIISIPCFAELTDAEIERVSVVVCDFFSNHSQSKSQGR